MRRLLVLFPMILSAQSILVGPSAMVGPTTMKSGIYANGYTYQTQFTVAAGKITGTVTSLGYVISQTWLPWRTTGNGGEVQNTVTQTVGNRALTVPADLIFTSDSAGTMLLSWEWETYNASTGAVNVWIGIPSAAVGTVVYAWYGQATVTTLQTTPTLTWSAAYLGVWHMSENPAGTAPQLNDSTTNVNHGTTAGSMTAGEQVTGQIDGSINPNGTTQYATLANAANFAFERTNSWSGCAWYKVTSNSSSAIISKQTNNGTTAGWALFLRAGVTNPSVSFTAVNASGNTNTLTTHTNTEFSQSVWHHACFTYNGTSNTSGALLYVDGSNQMKTDVSNNLTASILTATGPDLMARDTVPGIPLQGTLDETELFASGTVLTANQVTAIYNNQSSSATFWTVTQIN